MNYTLFNCPLHLVLQVLIQALVHLRGRGGLVVHVERRTRGPGFELHWLRPNIADIFDRDVKPEPNQKFSIFNYFDT